MKKEKSKYLLHPSNDMLLNSKILKDINGHGFNERFTSSGNEEEYVERSLLLTIKLGAADLPDQPLHKILGR